MKEKILEKVKELETLVLNSNLSDDERDEMYDILEDVQYFLEGRKFLKDSFTPCGVISREVISYVLNEVSSFDNRYDIALITMEACKCTLRSANNDLFMEIAEVAKEYLEDNCWEDGLELEEDLEEVFG